MKENQYADSRLAESVKTDTINLSDTQAPAETNNTEESPYSLSDQVQKLLSQREIEVLNLYVTGRSAERIGQTLYLSTTTVRTYIQRIYGKLGVHSRQELLDYLQE
ncbi:MAG: response regulator transcription factor [Coriobacteriales bacterium]|nr:response regulator transcription factor [Coriobacteriales bacterium]